MRPGTEPVTLAIGLAKALTMASENRSTYKSHLENLQNELMGMLLKSKLKYNQNSPKKGLSGIINLSFPGQNGEDLVARLDAVGLEVATGAACEANNEEPSKALLALGLNYDDAQASLRISFGRSTTATDLQMLVGALSDIIQPR